jgi:Cytochrome c7 and related cytochrome c
MNLNSCRGGTVLLCVLVTACGGPAAETSSGGVAPVAGRPLTSPSVGLPANSSATGIASTAPASTGSVGTTETRPATMAPLIASQMGAELASVGLDVAKLPPLQALTREQLNKVMATFTKATGLGCKGCHGDGGFAVDTPQKHLTLHMWNDMVRGLVRKEPGVLYCDSCHQSKAKFLDHSDDKSLANWMNAEFVQRLSRADSKPNSCASCHGTPFVPEFLNEWRKH